MGEGEGPGIPRMADTDLLVGFLFALGSAVFFGLYMVPRKMAHGTPAQFAVGMISGVLVGVTLLQLAGGARLVASARQVVSGYLSGVLWAAGIALFSQAVSRMGLARATPIKNTTAVMGTILALVFAGETAEVHPALALLGSGLVVSAAVILGRMSCEDGAACSSGGSVRGVALSLGAAVAFASYAVPLKGLLRQGVPRTEAIFWIAQGAFVGSLVFFCRRWRELRAVAGCPACMTWAPLGGLVWLAGALCLAVGIEKTGISIAWSVGNLNTLVAVAVGTWVFREVHPGRHRLALALGLLSAAAGVICLGVSYGR